MSYHQDNSQNVNREYEILDEVIVIRVDATVFIPFLFIQVLIMLLNNTFIISQNNSDAMIPPPAPPLKAQISPLVTMFNQDTPKQENVTGKVQSNKSYFTDFILYANTWM